MYEVVLILQSATLVCVYVCLRVCVRVFVCVFVCVCVVFMFVCAENILYRFVDHIIPVNIYMRIATYMFHVKYSCHSTPSTYT